MVLRSSVYYKNIILRCSGVVLIAAASRWRRDCNPGFAHRTLIWISGIRRVRISLVKFNVSTYYRTFNWPAFFTPCNCLWPFFRLRTQLRRQLDAPLLVDIPETILFTLLTDIRYNFWVFASTFWIIYNGTFVIYSLLLAQIFERKDVYGRS